MHNPREGVRPLRGHRPDGRNGNRNFEFLLLDKESIGILCGENIEVRWHRGSLGTTSQFYYPKPEVLLPKILCHAKPENTKGVGEETRDK